MMKKNGFTLAELLMVVVIIGVLGAVALPKFYPQKEKAVVAEAVAMLSAIRQGELGYRLENNVFKDLPAATATPSDWGQIGIDDPNTGTPRFEYSVDDVSGLATAQRLPKVKACAPNASPPVYDSCTVTLNLDTGAWGGTHPFHPTNT